MITMRSFFKSNRASLLVAITLLTGNLPVFADEALERPPMGVLQRLQASRQGLGFQLLQAHEYGRALEEFNAAAREHPDSAEPHFGRAKALLGLNRRDEALGEFKVCALLDPSGSMAERCRKEIEANTPQLDFGQSRTITTADIEKASTLITNQAASRMRALQDAGTIRSNYYTPSYGTYPPYGYSRNGWRSSYSSYSSGYYPSTYVSGSADGWAPRYSRGGWGSSYRSSYRDDGYRARALAEDTLRRSLAIQESAQGLTQAMSQRPSEQSGVYLSPHNTNLYVRNYVDFDPVRPAPPAPPVELSATPLRLEDVHGRTTGRNQSSVRAPQNSPPLSKAPQLHRRHSAS